MKTDLGGIVHVPGQVHIGERRRHLFYFAIILALGDFVQRRLDMLAGAELIDLEIGTGADIGAPFQAADGDAIALGKMVLRTNGLSLPLAERGCAAEMLDRHLGPTTLDPVPDGGVGGGKELPGRLLLLGVGVEHGDHVATDRSPIAAVALKLKSLIRRRNPDRAGHLHGLVLDLRPQPPLILINGDHPVFLERTQPLAYYRRVGHGFESFAVKEQRVLMLRGNRALHRSTPWVSGWCQSGG